MHLLDMLQWVTLSAGIPLRRMPNASFTLSCDHDDPLEYLASQISWNFNVLCSKSSVFPASLPSPAKYTTDIVL